MLECHIFFHFGVSTKPPEPFSPRPDLPSSRLPEYDYSVAYLIKGDVKRLYHHVTCHKVSWAHLDAGMDPQEETKYRHTWILQQNSDCSLPEKDKSS